MIQLLVLGFLGMVAQLKAQLYSTDFTGYTAGSSAIPANWSGSGFGTTAGVGQGGKQALTFSTFNGSTTGIFSNFADSNTLTQLAGNIKVVAVVKLNVDNSGPGCTFNGWIRRAHYDNYQGGLTDKGPAVGFSLGRGYGSSSFLSIVHLNCDGTTTTLSSLNPTLVQAEWYECSLSAQDANLSLQVRRISDNQYINSSGAFQSGATACLTATTTVMMAGTYAMSANSFNSGQVICDSWSIYQLNPSPVSPPPNQFLSGQRMYTEQGTKIHAHCGHIIYDSPSGFYYWYGTDMSGTNVSYPPVYENVYSSGVHLYRSRDLVFWKDLGFAWPNDGNWAILERPKVLYNSTTKKWVMFIHAEATISYPSLACLVLTAPSPEGPFTSLGTMSIGASFHDFTAYKDTDGTGYLIFDNGGPMYLLTLDSTYTAKAAGPTLMISTTQEAPAIIKNGSTYFMVCSDTSGWDPNQNAYYTASSMTGTWTYAGNPFSSASSFGENSSKGYMAQTNCILFDRDGVARLFCDRWNTMNFSESTEVAPAVSFPTSTTMQLTWQNGFSPTSNFSPPSSAGVSAAGGRVL